MWQQVIIYKQGSLEFRDKTKLPLIDHKKHISPWGILFWIKVSGCKTTGVLKLKSHELAQQILSCITTKARWLGKKKFCFCGEAC